MITEESFIAKREKNKVLLPSSAVVLQIGGILLDDQKRVATNKTTSKTHYLG